MRWPIASFLCATLTVALGCEREPHELPPSPTEDDTSNMNDRRELESADALSQRANIALSNRRYADAVRYAQQALEIRERRLAFDDFELGKSYWDLAVALHACNRDADAIERLRRAIAVLESGRFTDGPPFASCLSLLAECYGTTGNVEEAESLFERAIPLFENHGGEQNGDIVQVYAQTLSGLGMCYLARSRFDRAEEMFQRALAIQRAHLGENHADVATTLDRMRVLQRKRENR